MGYPGVRFFFSHLNGHLGQLGNAGSFGESGRQGKSGNTGSSSGNTGSLKGQALCFAGAGIPGNTDIYPRAG